MYCLLEWSNCRPDCLLAKVKFASFSLIIFIVVAIVTSVIIAIVKTKQFHH